MWEEREISGWMFCSGGLRGEMGALVKKRSLLAEKDPPDSKPEKGRKIIGVFCRKASASLAGAIQRRKKSPSQ